MHGKRHVVSVCDTDGGDSVGRLADGFLQLIECPHRKVEVLCCDLPDVATISLKRKGKLLHVSVNRNLRTRMKVEGPFIEALQTLVASLELTD